MKKTVLLNAPLSRIVAQMGHTDGLCIADAGLPIPLGPERIDLAVSPNIPRFIEVLDAVLDELVVERVLLAEEIRERNLDVLEMILPRIAQFRSCEVLYVPHSEFKQRSSESQAIVRTGEFSPFANIILYSGVPF